MESNKDESLKCIRLAEKHYEGDNYDAAVRFLNKAERLYPSQRAKDLLEKIEKRKSDPQNEKETNDKNTKKTREPSQERRNSKSDCHDLQPKYTQEQLESVRKIRKCKDYYEILGLTKDCSDEDLKKSYKKMALKFHPDKNHAPGATEAFKAIGNAFSVLSDSQKRQRYDEFGIEDSSSSRTRRTHGYDYDYSRGFEGDVSAEELFRMFFGGGHGFMANNHPRRQASAGSHARSSQERRESPYTLLLQLSPLICMIVLSLLSSFMVGQAQYSLRRDSKYLHERKTSNLGVTYYVRSDFAAGKDKNELASIERQVEDDYVVELQHSCYRERNNRETALWRAQMYGNNDLYRQASNMKLPSCDRLRTLNGG